MNKNVSIVVVLLVLVVIAGYLVWIRSRVSTPVIPSIEQVAVTAAPTIAPSATASASPSAIPGKEATGSVKQKTSK
ncbi:MAG: hypothetical protein Q7R77_04395 [Candidatus Daviesbacteria bacterium]|nr:hypothetical protein [Candidatus Daviesbacteria bacterium]